MKGLLIIAICASLLLPTLRATTTSDVIIGFQTSIPSDLSTFLAANAATLLYREDILAYAVAHTNDAEGLISAATARSDVSFSYVPVSGAVSSEEFCDMFNTFLALCSGGGGAPPPPSTGFPNDPYYYQRCGTIRCQWGNVLVNSGAAWNVSTGSTSTLVAVLDTGVDITHPEFTNALYRTGTIVGFNAFDPTTSAVDDNGHGTRVAGVLGARIGNAVGIAGMSNAKIMPVKVCDSAGACADDRVARGIAAAVSAGADVVEMSFYTPNTALLQRAVQLARNVSDIVLVSSAGNFASNGATYPGKYSEVISVAAVTPSGALASYSNYGSDVDLAAPGGANVLDERSILTTTKGSYGRSYGTSYAVPYVGGAAALIRGAHPTWTAAQVESKLFTTATSASGIPGHGILNAGAALS